MTTWTSEMVLAKLRAQWQPSVDEKCRAAFGDIDAGMAAYRAWCDNPIGDAQLASKVQLDAMAAALNLAEVKGAAKAWLAANPTPPTRAQCDRTHRGARCQMMGEHTQCMFYAGVGRDPVTAGQLDAEEPTEAPGKLCGCAWGRGEVCGHCARAKDSAAKADPFAGVPWANRAALAEFRPDHLDPNVEARIRRLDAVSKWSRIRSNNIAEATVRARLALSAKRAGAVLKEKEAAEMRSAGDAIEAALGECGEPESLADARAPGVRS